jgi:hypothetical protein
MKERTIYKVEYIFDSNNRKVGCIQTTWLVDEFLSKLMKHTRAEAEAEREIELVHI